MSEGELMMSPSLEAFVVFFHCLPLFLFLQTLQLFVLTHARKNGHAFRKHWRKCYAKVVFLAQFFTEKYCLPPTPIPSSPLQLFFITPVWHF